MNLNEFNTISLEAARDYLNSCCTSTRWQKEVIDKRPFRDREDFLIKQEAVWENLDEKDFLEAFDGHPKIGDVSSLKKKYAHTKDLAAGEQSGVDSASNQLIEELAEYNKRYEQRFGFIFIVCATGKSAIEMLEILKSRIDNDRETELLLAAKEQAKITKIRLEKSL